MKHSIAMLLVGILGIGGILYTAIINADVSGYGDVHGCWGECYEEYTLQYILRNTHPNNHERLHIQKRLR